MQEPLAVVAARIAMNDRVLQALSRSTDVLALDAPVAVTVGVGHHRLQPAAAEAFGQMRLAAVADGIDIGASASWKTSRESPGIGPTTPAPDL